MPAPDELYPPGQYGWGWALLALGILTILLAAAWVLIALTRPRRSIAVPAGRPAPPAGEVLAVLRQEYAERIDAIETSYRAGSIGAREANLRLSRTVRGFVNEYSGLEAPVLALADLVALGVDPALIDALHRHYYPSVFRPGPAVDPVAGADAARRVVTVWH